MLHVKRLFEVNWRINRRGMSLMVDKAFINGEWVESTTGDTFRVENPRNGDLIKEIPDMNASDAQKAIKSARKAFEEYKLTSGKQRSNLLRRFYEILTSKKEELAEIIHKESGKPLNEALVEVEYGNNYIEYYAEEARRIKGEIIDSPTNNKRYFVTREAGGVYALITPWNFPLAMLARKMGAALAAGCPVVCKPAEDTPLTALAMAKCVELAQFPIGLVNILTASSQKSIEIGKELCENESIAGISFTGSTHVGKLLYEQCASTMKRLSLELGGNAPFIIFQSADLDVAVNATIASKFRNCGQTCIASNRFLIEKDVLNDYLTKLTHKLGELSELGPLINRKQRDLVAKLVEDAVSKGANLFYTNREQIRGLFYPPTILLDVTPSMDIYNNEIFGPVIQISSFQGEDEALHLANSTRSGLASYFFTQNVEQMARVSRKLEFGMVGVNEGAISACEVPFGGVKESGLGREGGHQGLDEYLNYKYICLGGLN